MRATLRGGGHFPKSESCERKTGLPRQSACTLQFASLSTWPWRPQNPKWSFSRTDLWEERLLRSWRKTTWEAAVLMECRSKARVQRSWRKMTWRVPVLMDPSDGWNMGAGVYTLHMCLSFGQLSSYRSGTKYVLMFEVANFSRKDASRKLFLCRSLRQCDLTFRRKVRRWLSW